MKLLKSSEELGPLHQMDEQGNSQIIIPSKAKAFIKYGSLTVFALAALQLVLPSVLAVLANVLLFGTLGIFGVGGFLLYKNKDVRRALKIWGKEKAKTLVERTGMVTPLALNTYILANKRERLANIEKNLTNLIIARDQAVEKKKRTNKEIEVKLGLIVEAKNQQNIVLAERLAVEIARMDETILFCEDSIVRLNASIKQLELVQEAAQHKLEEDSTQFEQMKQQTEIVEMTHNALKSAEVIISETSEESQDFKQAIEDLRDQVVGKISEITQINTKTSPYIEQVHLEKKISGQLALKNIESRLLMLQEGSTDSSKQLPQNVEVEQKA